MEEKEKDLMQESEQDWIKFLQERIGNVIRATNSGKVRSVFRAMRRGKVTTVGTLMPSRPFNNRANTSKRKGVNSRVGNEEKKRFYEGLKRRTDKQSLQ